MLLMPSTTLMPCQRRGTGAGTVANLKRRSAVCCKLLSEKEQF